MSLSDTNFSKTTKRLVRKVGKMIDNTAYIFFDITNNKEYLTAKTFNVQVL